MIIKKILHQQQYKKNAQVFINIKKDKENYPVKKYIRKWYIYAYIYIYIHTHTYIYIVEYYSSIKKNEMLFATTWDWRVLSLVK